MAGPASSGSNAASRNHPPSPPSTLDASSSRLSPSGSLNPEATSTAAEHPPIPGSYPAALTSLISPTASTSRTQAELAAPVTPSQSTSSSPSSPSPSTTQSPNSASSLTHSPAASRQRQLMKTRWVPLLFGSIEEPLEEDVNDVEEGAGADALPQPVSSVSPSHPRQSTIPLPLPESSGLIAHLPDFDTLGGLAHDVEDSDESGSEPEQREDSQGESRRKRAREKRKRQEKQKKEQLREARKRQATGVRISAVADSVPDLDTRTPEEKLNHDRYIALASAAAQRNQQYESAALVSEEIKWFTGKTPSQRLIRQVRERHRPAVSYAHKVPWEYRFFQSNEFSFDLLFREDEPVRTMANFAASIEHFPTSFVTMAVAATFLRPHYPWGPALWQGAVPFDPINDQNLITKTGLMWIEGPNPGPDFAQAFVPFVSISPDLLWAFTVSLIVSFAAKKRLDLQKPTLILYFALPKGVEIPTKVILPDSVVVVNRAFPSSSSDTSIVPGEAVLEIRPRREEGIVPATYNNGDDIRNIPSFFYGFLVLARKDYPMIAAMSSLIKGKSSTARVEGEATSSKRIGTARLVPKASTPFAGSTSGIAAGALPCVFDSNQPPTAKLDELEEHFNNLTHGREPVMADIELHEATREEREWFGSQRPDHVTVQRTRESHRSSMDEDDDWFPIFFFFQPQYAISPQAFFTDVQRITENAVPGDVYFPLRSLEYGATYIFIDENDIIPTRMQSKAETIMLADAKIRLMPNIVIFADQDATDDDDEVDVLPHANLDRDIIWAFAIAVIVACADAERLKQPIIRRSQPLYITLPRGVNVPTWLVLPENVKIYTESFLPSGSPLVPEMVVLQISHLVRRFTPVSSSSMNCKGEWQTGITQIPIEPMPELHRKHLKPNISKGTHLESSGIDVDESHACPRFTTLPDVPAGPSRIKAPDTSQVEAETSRPAAQQDPVQLEGTVSAWMKEVKEELGSHKLVKIGTSSKGQVQHLKLVEGKSSFSPPTPKAPIPPVLRGQAKSPAQLTSTAAPPRRSFREHSAKPYARGVPNVETAPVKTATVDPKIIWPSSHLQNQFDPKGIIRIRVSGQNRRDIIFSEHKKHNLARLMDAWTNAVRYKIDNLPTLDLTKWHPPVDKGKDRAKEVTQWKSSLRNKLDFKESPLYDWQTPETAGMNFEDNIWAEDVKEELESSGSEVDVMGFVARGSNEYNSSDEEGATDATAVIPQNSLGLVGLHGENLDTSEFSDATVAAMNNVREAAKAVKAQVRAGDYSAATKAAEGVVQAAKSIPFTSGLSASTIAALNDIRQAGEAILDTAGVWDVEDSEPVGEKAVRKAEELGVISSPTKHDALVVGVVSQDGPLSLGEEPSQAVEASEKPGSSDGSTSDSDYPDWAGPLEDVLGPIATSRIRKITLDNKLRHHNWNHLLVSPEFDNLMAGAGLKVGLLTSFFTQPNPIQRVDRQPKIETVNVPLASEAADVPLPLPPPPPPAHRKGCPSYRRKCPVHSKFEPKRPAKPSAPVPARAAAPVPPPNFSLATAFGPGFSQMFGPVFNEAFGPAHVTIPAATTGPASASTPAIPAHPALTIPPFPEHLAGFIYLTILHREVEESVKQFSHAMDAISKLLSPQQMSELHQVWQRFMGVLERSRPGVFTFGEGGQIVDMAAARTMGARAASQAPPTPPL